VVCVRAVDDRESPAERLGSVTSALASKQRRENPFAGFVARVFVAKTVPTALCAKTGCAWDASSGITATVIGGSDQATANAHGNDRCRQPVAHSDHRRGQHVVRLTAAAVGTGSVLAEQAVSAKTLEAAAPAGP